MSEQIEKLLNEYKETARCMEMSIDWLNDKDYARGKLDLVKTVIADLEKLACKEK